MISSHVSREMKRAGGFNSASSEIAGEMEDGDEVCILDSDNDTDEVQTVW